MPTKTSTNQIYIIAEAGVNHNGSLTQALSLVEAAAKAGVNAIKFQTFIPRKLAIHNAPKAQYQYSTTSDNETQLELLTRLALKNSEFVEIQRFCMSIGIDFLSSCFDQASATFISKSLGLSNIKIGSGELTNGPLLLHIAQMDKNILLSTGMATLGEIESALSVLAFGFLNPHDCSPTRTKFHQAYHCAEGKNKLNQRVTLLHCTTEYPCPDKDVNLNAMHTLKHSFGMRVGFSDHSQGISLALAAAALGAKVIEKHFTLDKNMTGPDHAASLEPNELVNLVVNTRRIEIALGDGCKRPAESEIKNITKVRKYLVAIEPIKKGELFSSANISSKRSSMGISPMRYWDVLGQSASRDYEPDEVIECPLGQSSY